MSALSPLAALAYLAFLLFICGLGSAVKENRKRRSRELLRRLNSSYFRQVTDVYYRANRL